MTDKWNWFHIAFITNVMLAIYLGVSKTKTFGLNPKDVFWGYTLLAVLGVVAIVIWRVTDKWAVRYKNKKGCPRNRIVFVRNIFISLIVAAWTDSCIVINHLVGVEKTQISLSNIILSLIMAIVVVGSMTALWCKIKK